MASAVDRRFKLSVLLSVIDLLTFNVIFFLNVVFDLYVFPESVEDIYSNLLISNASYFIALQFVTISLHHRMSQPASVLKNTSRTSVIFMLLYAAILGISGFKVPNLSSSIMLVVTVFFFTSVERLMLRTYIRHKRSTGSNRVNTVIWGANDMTQKATDVMTDVWNGYNLLGYFNPVKVENITNNLTGEEIPYLGTEENMMTFLEKHQVDELYIGSTTKDRSFLKELFLLCEKKMIRIYYIPVSAYKEFRKAKIMEFGDIYIMSQYNEPLHDVRKRMQKRALDIVVSLLFICTLFPIILLIVAIISKITMPGPLFFKQKRTGYDGKDFYCYKFRSMKVNKDSDKVQAVKNDPRITKWGQFMRHTNIDELPQFINVLKGDMSIVGPRPHMLAHTDYYSQFISDYMIRHYVKPGITGWAQTHGERGETKTVEDMKRRVQKDIWYIEHWSFWLDIQIILKTISDTICGDEKAY